MFKLISVKSNYILVEGNYMSFYNEMEDTIDSIKIRHNGLQLEFINENGIIFSIIDKKWFIQILDNNNLVIETEEGYHV